MGTRNLRLWATGLVLLAVPFALAACDDPVDSEASAATTLASQTGLAGTWTLNPEESELPHRMRDGHGGEEGTAHRGRRHRRSRRGADDGSPHGGRQLVIAQDEASVSIQRGQGQAHTFYTDGRTETKDLPRGGQVEISASIEGGDLVIRQSHEGGGSMVRRFTLSNDGQKLFVKHSMENPERERSAEFMSVYDREDI